MDTDRNDVQTPNPRRIRAEAEFRARLSAGGSVLLEPYAGSKHRHHTRCANGHDSYVHPNWVQQGNGLCKTCSGKDSAEGRFTEYLARWGAQPAWDSWRGNKALHSVMCKEGHTYQVKPNTTMSNNKGPGCRRCSGHDSAWAEARFIAYLESLGATPTYDTWKGSCVPHSLTCAEGHEVTVCPASERLGHGVCRVCAGMVWDVFYVVSGAGMVKFGVTSGDPRGRLGFHAASGIRTQHLVRDGLQGNLAKDTEDFIIDSMRRLGYAPVKGREYFPSSCLDQVLRLAREKLS